MFWNKATFLLLAVVVCAVGLLMKAALALLLGMLLVVFAFQKLPDAPAFSVTNTDAFLLYGAFVLGLAGSGLAAGLSAQRDFKFNTIDVALWLAAMLLIIAAAVWHDRRYWMHLVSPERKSPSRRNLFLEVGFVLLTTLVALGLRIYDLTTLPPMVHGDEGEVGMLALRILEGQEPLPIFAATVFGQNPAGFPYLMAPFLATFGRNEVGLRILSVVVGTASVPLLYLIGRSGWGLLAGASAAWLMTVSHFHIHYSRLAVPNIGNSFVVVLMIWLLFWAYQRNMTILEKSPTPGEECPAPIRTWYDGLWMNVPLAEFVVVGLVIGLGQYVYHGARLLPIIAGVVLLFQLRAGKITYLQMTMLGVAALVAVAPLGTYYLTHWQEFIGRSETVFIFREENLKHVMGADATFAEDLLPYLSHQFVTTLGLFTGHGDRSSFYLLDIPAFDPMTLILLWLGFGSLLTRLRRFEESVIVTWLLLGMLFAGFLTIEQPNGPRVISIVPAIYLIGGIFVQRVWCLLPAFTRERSRLPAALAMGGLALVLVYLNGRTYFIDFKGYTLPVLPTAVAHAIAAAPNSAAVYLIGDPILYAGHGTIRFLAGTNNIFDLKTSAELPDPNANDGGTLIVVLEHRLDDLQGVKEQYPDGEYMAYSDLQGRFLFATYYLP